MSLPCRLLHGRDIIFYQQGVERYEKARPLSVDLIPFFVVMEHFLLPVDLEKQAWGKKMKIGTVNNLFDGSGDKICYLYDSSSFYECGTDFEDKELLFRWADLGLASGDSHVCTLGDGRFAVLSSSFSQTMLNSYEYCVVEPGEDNRTVLTMVSLQPEYSILDAIAQFNKSNRDYRVELRAIFPMDESVSDADWNNALMKLNTEMISGKTPTSLT